MNTAKPTRHSSFVCSLIIRAWHRLGFQTIQKIRVWSGLGVWTIQKIRDWLRLDVESGAGWVSGRIRRSETGQTGCRVWRRQGVWTVQTIRVWVRMDVQTIQNTRIWQKLAVL